MAKNYSIAEATKVIADGTDLEALQDLGRRFPVLSIKLAKLTEKAGEEVNDLFQYLPEHLSANKVNQAIKATINGANAEAEDVEVDEDGEPVEAKPAKVAGKKDGTRDYASMSGGDLWKLLGECGARKACEKEFASCKKAAAIAYFEKYGETVADAGETEPEEKPSKAKAQKPAKAKKVMPEPEEAEADDETEAEVKDYSKMNAMELFKECKAKGIKAETKKPAKYYRDLLAKAEAEANEAEDEDWEDGDTEADEEPVKPAKKAPAKKAEKPAKKAPAKKAEAEDDDDEDWDI